MNPRHQEIASAVPADLDSLPRLRGFRLRGMEMTRLETFIDAAFAFSVTMMVISVDRVPDNVNDLLAAFRNVPAFIASIAVLGLFWRGHWLWSRRYGLEDGVSIFISWTMLVTILIYIYPLKVVFGGMWYLLSDRAVGQSISLHTAAQARALFAIFAIGFTAIALEILLLNLRAYHLREALRLNKLERVTAQTEITGWGLPAVVGLISLLLALTLPSGHILWSGWVYFSMVILEPLHALVRKRRIRAAAAAPA
jgi:uncharacterized membrane protein